MPTSGSQTHHDRYLRVKHFGGMDGLRALSICFVILFHAGVGGVVARGVHGVSTFFAISGFLVTTILLREKARTGTISARRFALRRMLRIWPLYFTVLGLYVAIVWILEGSSARGVRFFQNLPAYATFTSNVFVQTSPGERVIFLFAWSLATQEQFYLVWPAMLRAFRRPWVPAAFAALLIVGQLTAVYRFGGPFDSNDPLLRLVSSAWTPLCAGALIAYALHQPQGFRLLRPLVGRAWSVPLAVGLVVTSAHPAVPLGLIYLAVAYLVAAVAMRPPAILDHPVLRSIGMVSYGMYLFHMLAINVVGRVLPVPEPLVTACVSIPLTWLAARLSFDHFESRFLALKDRLTGRTGVRSAEPTPATVQLPGA